MRNLYSRLKISRLATTDQIQSAVDACANSTLKADAAGVLLNPNRKEVYDRLNDTMITIAQLRGELGLTHADNWSDTHAGEYACQSAPSGALYENFHERLRQVHRKAKIQSSVASAKSFMGRAAKIVSIGAVAVLALIWILNGLDKDSTAGTSNRPQRSTTPTFNVPALPLPSSGAVRRHTSAIPKAPLEIRTSGSGNYLVKLQYLQTDRDVLDVFVRGGDTVEIEVPLGVYTVKYASGSSWYGYTHYFGPNTSYTQADSAFQFREEGNQYSGYTITLYQVAGGNLETSRINPSQF